MTTPLDRRFNVAVNHIASRLFPTGFDVADDAPQTLEELTAHIKRTGRMAVWSGASERTVFSDPETNYAFRAWHDWHHWRHQLPFDAEGERKVCERQIADVRLLYGYSADADRMVAILEAEVLGQLAHQVEHGEFPKDQHAFAAAWLSSSWQTGTPF